MEKEVDPVGAPQLELVHDADAESGSRRSLEALDDAKLLTLARASDDGAWGVLYRRHHARTFRYACYLTRDRDLAEEVTQETYARALGSLNRFRGDAAFTTWIDRIALNVCREMRRKRSGQRRVKEILQLRVELTEAVEHLDQGHRDELRSRALLAAVDELPGNLREIFILRELLGMSPAEVAARVGISKNNAAVRAHRARKSVTKILRKAGWIEGEET